MDNQTKVLTGRNKTITLEKLFEQKENTRKIMARLSFEDKIKALVSLQELAHSWGKKRT